MKPNNDRIAQVDLHTIILNFYGPFKFVRGVNYLFSSDMVKKEGIYIWTIKDEKANVHYVHYIGETKSFGKRQREHLIQMTGLNYGIWDSELAREGISKMIWKGMWRDKSAEAMAFLLENYVDLSYSVKNYIGIINVFFAPTIIDTHLRRHIEGCIGGNLRNKYPLLKTFYPDDNHIGSNEYRLGWKIILNIPEDIAGIDREQYV